MKGGHFLVLLIICTCVPYNCEAFKILAIFPSNGRSHHLIFSSFVEELASRNHEVTVINYLPVKKMPNLRQISLHRGNEPDDNMNIEENLKTISPSFLMDFYRAYYIAVAFKEMADENCRRLMTNENIKKLIATNEKYDLVISEQFVTDCGLAIAYKLNVPVVGMTAHIMLPWTYSRLGASNNPVFVPNHFFASGSTPGLWQKMKSAVINFSMNTYYRYILQNSNQKIVNKVYPEVPDLESLGYNISLVMLNQYFPLTGSRLHGDNVIEVGGMHVKENKINDKKLQNFLDNAENDVVYISFGTVAKNIPSSIIREIMTLVKTMRLNFVWKLDNNITEIPKNLFVREWLPQSSILCHPKVVAFVSHSGMLSTSEAVHCGVPMIAVPLFGDQFTNAEAVLENGLGVVLDIYLITSKILKEALDTILLDRYQKRAKEFSQVWRDRPVSAMDTAVFWVEYVARHRGTVNMKPRSVNLSTFEYFMVDALLVLCLVMLVIIYAVSTVLNRLCKAKPVIKMQKPKKH